MAYKLIWSPLSRDDLHDIVRYISLDSPQRAESFAYRLIQQTDLLQEHAEIGRRVPEFRNQLIREIVFKPYRIVYRLDHSQKVVEIIRVWHAARGTPRMTQQ
jgi:plasmid stabilization system protein ParE